MATSTKGSIIQKYIQTEKVLMLMVLKTSGVLLKED